MRLINSSPEIYLPVSDCLWHAHVAISVSLSSLNKLSQIRGQNGDFLNEIIANEKVIPNNR